MIHRFNITISVTLLLIISGLAPAGSYRFPPPEFEGDYVMPGTTEPQPRSFFYDCLDVAVLFGALVLSSYFVLKTRSRRAVFILMIISLIYFGFWRKGCICPIGAIQNIVYSFFDPDYTVPVLVLLFFLLPLIFTLFFGRTFCSAVCPLGAVQDLVLLRPVRLSVWAENGLRILAYLYLGLAVLFAATGSAFLVCRYDPFISFFRLSGNFNLIVFGLSFLIIGFFIGRPYCRFLCPYGIILRQLSRISKWRVTITPDECIQCKLCEDSCPFGAIRKPAEEWSKKEYSRSKRRLILLLTLLPALTVLGGWTGSKLKNVNARMHETVRLAEQVRLEETGQVEETTDASDAFREMGMDTTELYESASAIRDKFELGGWILGGFMGLIIALKLIGVSVWRTRTDYEADRANCLACGRCFNFCPREHKRREEKSNFNKTGII